jgi:putative flavoprotein involved in K+ transport
VSGVTDGRPLLADGTVLDVRNVIWCTGFKQVFDWIEVPVFGPDGWPRGYRGVCDEAPGLFFCGLSLQYAFSSMAFLGVGRDAEFIAGKITARCDDLNRARESAGDGVLGTGAPTSS